MLSNTCSVRNKSGEGLIILFQWMLDIVCHVTCHIVLMEDPIKPREDNQNVWVYTDMFDIIRGSRNEVL